MSRTAVTSLAFGFMVDYSLTASTSSHVASIGSPLRRNESNITWRNRLHRFAYEGEDDTDSECRMLVA